MAEADGGCVKTFTVKPTTMFEFEVISNFCAYCRDVVSKNKLEMLPGNGTIILETIWSINLSIKSSINNDKSNTIESATHRVYQTVAR